MRRFLLSFIRNSVLVHVLLLLILVVGALSGTFMVREVFPEIAVDIINVSVFYPGADPEEVEEGISRKIEEAIDGLQGVKLYRTVSMENMSQTVVEVEEGYDKERLYKDVRNAVDSISTFPVDAEKPIISEFAIEDEVILLTLWGDLPERTLKEFAEDIKDELQSLPSVSQVNINGTRDYELAIEVSEERLREYNLSFREVAEAVRRGSMNLGGGQLRTKGEEIRLRTLGRKYTGEEFAKIVVLARPDGEIITLDRIAEIRDGFMEDEILSEFNGHPAVTIGVFKTPSQDAIAIAREVREYVDRKQKELPKGVNATLWSDRSVFIQQRLDLLTRNGIYGLIIVFVSLWLLLEFRLSFWVTMGIPVSLSGGLFLMWLVGATLNELSLFGLIMILGIVVDDAIIVGEAIYVHRRRGDPPMLAAVNGVMEVGLPVFAAVSTTIIAFIPLLFVKGVMGKFVEIIPVAVIASLVVSLVESLFLLPAHLNHLPDLSDAARSRRTPGNILRHGISQGMEWFVQHLYLPFVKKALHYRYISLCLGIFILLTTLGLVGGGFVKFVLFPEFDQQDIIASVEFPRGTPAAVTRDAIRQTEEAFRRVAERLPRKDDISPVKNIQSVVGQDSGMAGFDQSNGGHVGFVRVELVMAQDRDVSAQEILRLWEAETGPISGTLNQTFLTAEEGPPGPPIMITLKGQSMDTLLAVAEELKAKLKTYDGVYQVSDTFRPGKNELRLKLKPEARPLGIQLDDLARQVYAGYFGEEALRIQRGRNDIRVRVRYTRDQRSTMAELEKVRIRTAQGYEVPFFSVADVEFARGPANIVRIDGLRAVSVTAENDPQKANPDEILGDLAATELPRLEARYPGFMWEFDGPQKQSRDAFAGLMVSFPMAFAAMFIIVAAVFRSYVQPIIVMISVPFGVVGAVWGHYFMGIDLAMFSVFGMVALAGIVVNDAIVLIEAVNHHIAEGMSVFEAIARGGARRFRAIILTSVTTIGGLAPLILEKEAGAEVIIPMALSIASGVAFTTVLTLTLVPCLLGILNDFRCGLFLLLKGRVPTREEVEPARLRYIDPLEEAASQPAGGPVAAK